MPPKKTIAFGKIGAFGKLSINPVQSASKNAESGFGKFGKAEDEFKTEPTTDVEKMMGFQGFGKNKAAKTFDLDSLVEQSKQVARERNVIKEQEAGTSQSDKEEESENDDDEIIGPLLPPPSEPAKTEMKKVEVKSISKKPPTKAKSSEDEDSDSSDEDDTGSSGNFIPATLEVDLNHGTKTVSALSVDHSGARLVTGSVDYDVKLWDFAGMSSTLQSFRSIRPCEWYVGIFKKLLKRNVFYNLLCILVTLSWICTTQLLEMQF